MRGLIDQTRSASSFIKPSLSVISSERSESRDLFLLAVSGGIDSMCLADLWLRAFGPDSCAIAHCNFNLRGEDSDADEALVTEWADSHGVRLHKVSFDTLQYASENGVSIEMAARELRYRWFGELCAEQGYAAVVVAHHADDNAETMVLNMVRGAGLKGLTGMKHISPLPMSIRVSGEGREISLLRPLLTFTRKQLEGHAFAWRVPYREDKTNSSVEYRRNSIRHEVFPLFRRMNPSYVRTLNREMSYLSDAFDIVDQWCKSQISHVIASSGATWQSVPLKVSIPSLLSIPQWRYLLYYILEPYGFNTSTLESLEALLMSDRTISGKRFESEDYVLLTEREELVLSKKESAPLSLRPSEASGEIFSQVPAPGTYHINGSRVIIEALPWTSDMPLKQPEGTVVIDAAKLKFPFVLRKWRSGDWMIPLGMKGKKKISDLFTDLKYGHVQKDRAVILVDMAGDLAERQHVAGVAGVRIDDRYKVTDNTETIIRITIS